MSVQPSIYASLFTTRGFEVVRFERGVYLLRKALSPSETELSIGLLYTDRVEPTKVMLYTQTVHDVALVPRMMAHWSNLDARRLGESGVDALRIALDEPLGAPIEFPRENGEGRRYGAKLRSGDVVCFN